MIYIFLNFFSQNMILFMTSKNYYPIFKTFYSMHSLALKNDNTVFHESGMFFYIPLSETVA